MTRIAALDRRPDPYLAAAVALLGGSLGAALAVGFLAGRLTIRRTP